jgi:hypothetical protein
MNFDPVLRQPGDRDHGIKENSRSKFRWDFFLGIGQESS